MRLAIMDTNEDVKMVLPVRIREANDGSDIG